jgi:hypothetical protein
MLPIVGLSVALLQCVILLEQNQTRLMMCDTDNRFLITDTAMSCM